MVFKIDYIKHADDMVELHFRIEDPGVGIASDMLAAIFLPFQQVRYGKYI